MKSELYCGKVIVDFDEEEHAYKVSQDGGEFKLIDGFSGIKERAMGVSHVLAGWRQKMQAEHTIEKYLEWNEEGKFPESYDDFKTLASGTITSPFIKEITAGKSAWRKVAKKATDVGKLVHAYAEKHPCERPKTDNYQAINGFDAVDKFFEQLPEILGSEPDTIFKERIVCSIKHWYCGTVDRLFHIPGENGGTYIPMDFKTSKPFKNDWNGPYFEQQLQLAAYAVALEEEFGIDIYKGMVVRTDKETGNVEPYMVQISPLLKQTWLAVRTLEMNQGKLERSWTKQAQLAA